MTERRKGAPDPVEPSSRGDAPASGAPTGDLSAVRRTDAVFEALARHAASCAPGTEPAAEEYRDADAELDERLRAAEAESDPAVRLLRALVADVGDPGPDRHPGPEPPSGPRRRGRRTIVALGVAGAVLASGGVAAAGGDLARRSAQDAKPGKGITQRQDESSEAHRQTLRPAARPRPTPGVPVPDAGRGADVPRKPTTPAPSGTPTKRPERDTGRDEKKTPPKRTPDPAPSDSPYRGPSGPETPPPTYTTQPVETSPPPESTPPTGSPWLIQPPQDDLQRRIDDLRRRLLKPDRSRPAVKPYVRDVERSREGKARTEERRADEQRDPGQERR